MSDEQSISIPSHNPANNQDLLGVLDFYSKIIKCDIEKVTPAQIVSYDRKKNRAVVQILNLAVTTEGEKIARKQLIDIPVFIFGAGGFAMGFPIESGDIGFIIAADGDVSVWKRLLQIFTPATYQKHKYKDGVFFPLIINDFKFNADEEKAVLITSLDQKTKIAIKDDYITVTSKNVIVNSEDSTVNTTTATLNATTTTVNSETFINGNITQVGNYIQTGTFTSTGVVTGLAGLVDGTGSTGVFDVVNVIKGIVKPPPEEQS